MSDSLAQGFGEGLILGNAFSNAGTAVAKNHQAKRFSEELIEMDNKLAQANLRADKAETKVCQLEKENQILKQEINKLKNANNDNLDKVYNDIQQNNLFNAAKDEIYRNEIENLENQLKISQNDFLDFFARNEAKTKLIKKKIDEGVLDIQEVTNEIDKNVIDLAERIPRIRDTKTYKIVKKLPE